MPPGPHVLCVPLVWDPCFEKSGHILYRSVFIERIIQGLVKTWRNPCSVQTQNCHILHLVEKLYSRFICSKSKTWQCCDIHAWHFSLFYVNKKTSTKFIIFFTKQLINILSVWQELWLLNFFPNITLLRSTYFARIRHFYFRCDVRIRKMTVSRWAFQ